jgi:hypothetical protein
LELILLWTFNVALDIKGGFHGGAKLAKMQEAMNSQNATGAEPVLVPGRRFVKVPSCRQFAHLVVRSGSLPRAVILSAAKNLQLFFGTRNRRNFRIGDNPPGTPRGAYYYSDGAVRINTMTVKPAKLLLLGIAFVALCGNATELVVQNEVSVSRALAGQVAVLGTGEPANGVTVDLCTPDWKSVIASTRTDDKGHFSLEQAGNTKLFYLRVSAPGMDIYQLRVRIDKYAGQELNIRLSIAT